VGGRGEGVDVFLLLGAMTYQIVGTSCSVNVGRYYHGLLLFPEVLSIKDSSEHTIALLLTSDINIKVEEVL